MGGDLAANLLDAGLVTPRQLESARSQGLHGSRLARALTDQGLDENALAGFFISKGFGPLLDRADLDRAQTFTTEKLPSETARELFAVPVRASAAGVIVAMADPTDQSAIRVLEETFTTGVLPTVARVSELAQALERIYPESSRWTSGAPPSDTLELSRPRKITQAVPLVRPKERAIAEPAESPAETESQSSESAAPAWPSVPVSEPAQVPATPKPSYPVFDPGPHLATIERAVDRDAVIEATCQAVAAGGRAACFIAIRKKVFRGWYGSGSGVTRDGIRSLWIPVDKACSLRDALEMQAPYSGTFGQTAADQLLRAALGGEGQLLNIVPVSVAGKTIGLLCASDWRSSSEVLTTVADAAGEALARIIKARKA